VGEEAPDEPGGECYCAHPTHQANVVALPEVSQARHVRPSQEFPSRSLGQVRTAYQPRSTGFELARNEEALHHRFLACTVPSRSPSPTHPAVLGRPDFVAAAPTLPGVSRLRLPPASPTCHDRPAAEYFHLRTKQQRLVAHHKESDRPVVELVLSKSPARVYGGAARTRSAGRRRWLAGQALGELVVRLVPAQFACEARGRRVGVNAYEFEVGHDGEVLECLRWDGSAERGVVWAARRQP
jgi:hypothetical protein